MVRTLGLVLLYVSTVLAMASTLAFMVLHPGWRHTTEGRHLAFYMGTVALILLVWTMGAVLDTPDWWQTVRLVTFALLPLALAQRLWLIVRTYLRGE